MRPPSSSLTPQAPLSRLRANHLGIHAPLLSPLVPVHRAMIT
jgi:hypothetical protein